MNQLYQIQYYHVLTIKQEKIIREVAIYADKSDITEEIVRFKFHIKGFLDNRNWRGSYNTQNDRE